MAGLFDAQLECSTHNKHARMTFYTPRLSRQGAEYLGVHACSGRHDSAPAKSASRGSHSDVRVHSALHATTRATPSDRTVDAPRTTVRAETVRNTLPGLAEKQGFEAENESADRHRWWVESAIQGRQ